MYKESLRAVQKEKPRRVEHLSYLSICDADTSFSETFVRDLFSQFNIDVTAEN